ncbi:hypothetical protein JCM8547_003836 [Rhodosporidiobolus lusitaniae]
MELADPHFETNEHDGKQRKRKRATPPELSKHDERILRSVRRRAHYPDKGFSLCGFRWDGRSSSALFPVPVVLPSSSSVTCWLRYSLVQRMTLNQIVGLGIGLVPLVGDLMLAVWKANSRNAALLEDFLIRRAAQHSTAEDVAGEEALGELALGDGGGTIDRKTGEKVGGMKAATPPGSAGGSGVATPVERAAGQEEGGRRWYGWGRGKKADPAPATVSQ